MELIHTLQHAVEVFATLPDLIVGAGAGLVIGASLVGLIWPRRF